MDAIEKRRGKAIARTLGLSSLGNLMSMSFRQETGLIRALWSLLKLITSKLTTWMALKVSI